MNILLFGTDPGELRKNLPKSRFFYSDFDPFIIGIETNSGSIIYDLEEVLIHMISTENPYAFETDDQEEFEYVYNETFKNLGTTSSQIGMDELREMIDFIKKYPSEDIPYTFCRMEDVIEWIIREMPTN